MTATQFTTPAPRGRDGEKTLRLKVMDAHVRAMQYLEDWFVARCEEEFNQVDWKYLTNPKIRDIVNTGKLRDNVRVTQLPQGSFEVQWYEDYAFDVHEGGTTFDGQKFLGRPWTRDPIAELPAKYAEFFQNALQQS